MIKTLTPENPNRSDNLLVELSVRYSELLLSKYLEIGSPCRTEVLARQSVAFAKALVKELEHTNECRMTE
jgi:hypothetical protein